MLSLIYVSSACEALSADELKILASICESNNRRDAITGMLLHRNGQFMQLLEGVRRKVDDKKQRIVLDPRHRNLLVLSQDIVPERAFYDKPMGFYDLDLFPDRSINVDGIDLQRAFSDDVFIKNPRNARNLLLSFR